MDSNRSNSSSNETSTPKCSVAVIIVNWNGGLYVLRCLESVKLVRPMVDHVVVVDNGSHDGSADACARYYPEAIILRNPENLGFAAACNQGMKHALDLGVDFVFLLNNDAELRPETISHLVEAAERRPECGLFAGKILTDDGRRIWCAGVDVGFFPNLQRLRGFNQPDRGQFESEQEVSALTGCGLLIRRTLLEEVGFFDTDFFVYLEDIDLAWRARKKGMKSLYVPQAVMQHAFSASTGGGYSPMRKYMAAYNLVLFLKKHRSFDRWAAFIVFEILLWPVLYLWSLIRGQSHVAIAKWKGTWSALLGMPMKRPDAAVATR